MQQGRKNKMILKKSAKTVVEAFPVSEKSV